MKNSFRIIALILVVLMIVSLVSGFVISGVMAEAKATSVENLQSELDELAKKKEELERELAVIKDKKEQELEKKSIIDEQINTTRNEISVLNEVISSLNSDLSKAEADIDSAELIIEEKVQLCKDRIRSAYEQGEASNIELFLNSKTFYDYITKAEIVSQIAESDQKIIDEYIAQKNLIEVRKKEIELKKAENEAAKVKLDNKKKTLSAKQAASDKLIDEMNSDEEATKRAVEAAEAAEAELQSEIKAALAATSNSAVVDTGEFRWPLSGKFNNITSEFGYRTHPVTGVYKLHTGVDIASSGISGTAIYAAKGGTVIKAGYNRGYGNYVVIDHGGGYATLYGHASVLNVTAGQVVTKGDVIGKVGSSGYSTGPHLHFEIIKNSEYTNPLDYFRGVMSFTYR